MKTGSWKHTFKVMIILIQLTVITPLECQTRNAADGYEPTWPSLESRHLPVWYDADKFGIFIHWGVYSVPALGEWFWYNWKFHKSPTAIKYMTDNYKPNFTYQEFAREFTASLFNATEWALIFKESGARYVVLTSKHHDGYTLWPSKYSFSWNSVDVGPHRDIVGDLANAVRKYTNLRFGLYHSLYEWYNPLYVDDQAHNFTTNNFVIHKTMPELYELVNAYHPEVIWSDGEWEVEDEYWKAREFLAWLYNKSPVKNSIVVNDRWGSNTLCKHGGFLTCQDRYNPKKLQNRKWENAMTIDKRSWGYRKNAALSDYLSSHELIESLVATVSCGGNLLLNVGPTSDGKILPIYEERLLQIGKWLSVNGEAIFATKPWKVCQNDTLTPDLWYTTRVNSSQEIIYAIFLHWPNEGKIRMKCIDNLNNSAQIEFVGIQSPELLWTNLNGVIEVILPNKAHISTDLAWTLKIINSTGTEYATAIYKL